MSEVILFPTKKKIPTREKLPEDHKSLFSCGNCENKTFVVDNTNDVDDYPLLVCAACGAEMGPIAWMEEDEVDPTG